VQENGCAACHAINGVKKPDNFAPDLSKVGSRSLAQLLFTPGLSHDIPSYISAKILDPRSFGTSLKMPRFKLSNQEVDSLTTALLAQTDRSENVAVSLRVPSPKPSTYRPAGPASKLIADLRCFSCHAINGRGGDMAPDLSLEGSAVNRAWLVGFFMNPNTLRPALIRRMPKFNLSNQEAQLLSDEIMNVYRSPDVADGVSQTHTPADVEHGRQLFYGKFACQSCHIVDPAKDKGYIGPTLTKIGNRLAPDWMYSYLRNPQAFRPGTLEPNQQINDADARALVSFLAAQRGKTK
jgi:cytochrome c2